MKKIVFTEPLHISKNVMADYRKKLENQGLEITGYDTPPSSQEELADRIADADIAVIANTPFKREALSKCSHLAFLCVAFSGVNHVDLKACREKHVAVSNCAGYSTEAVAELVFGLIIGLYRKMAENDHLTRSGGKAAAPGMEIGGKRLGIIGTGRIGQRVAALGKAFGCDVVGWNRSRNDPAMSYVPLEELLKTSDIVSIHLPLTEETKNFISAKELHLMKPGALLINTARGPVVNGRDLAEALEKQEIGGAGIDVFDTEPPLSPDLPLLHAPNTLFTPHIGFNTEESMLRRMEIAYDVITSYLKGQQKNKIL